ncbi:hypothetical protein SHIRM173S_12161 [Streptomyces hirsutus]
MNWTLYLPSATSLSIVSPTVCSNEAQIGQRGSSYSSRVFFASALPMTTVVPFSPLELAGLTSFASAAASHAPGLLACMTA